MDHAITWGEYITVRLMIGLGFFVLCVALVIVKLIASYWKDMHANDEKPSNEPYAGKTLGL